MRSSLAIIVLALVSGCMPSTVTELRSSGEHVKFEAQAPYQQVYRNLLSMMRECAFRGFLFAAAPVDGEIYPDLGIAEIRHASNNMGDHMVLFQAEIAESGAGSMVRAYAAGGSTQHLSHLPAWADGASSCEP